MFNKKILITGLIRNGGSLISKEILALKEAFSDFKKIDWLIIESDSDDNTVEQLAAMREKIECFTFFPINDLSKIINLRTERIAFCRNLYLDQIRNNKKYKDLDYVVVADLDGTNNLLTQEAVQSCFENNLWDVCTANQSEYYYDIWALRHPAWCPGDCWEQYRYLMKFAESLDQQTLNSIKYAAVYSKMIHIPADADWIPVNSAFGGLAIYKKEVLISKQNYVGLNANGEEMCDHVSLHENIIKNGFKIYINPKFINTGFTEHSEPLKSLFKP
jgi:hypothetical protein